MTAGRSFRVWPIFSTEANHDSVLVNRADDRAHVRELGFDSTVYKGFKMRDTIAQAIHAFDRPLQFMDRSFQVRECRTQRLIPQQLLPGILTARQHEPPHTKRHDSKQILMQRLPKVRRLQVR
ncbi:hypothetical protein AB4Z38_12085 [Arthrobacter sp. 2RAF6]|uniref:hypothetical protein n=1 Tax=Arthrobacter sp. 2RAF6 TaxID=3233002 RepID=UPI003F902ED6